MKKSPNVCRTWPNIKPPTPKYYIYIYIYCRGKGPGSYIRPWALSEDTNGFEDKQIIMRYSQTRSH